MRKKMIRDLVLKVALIVTATSIAVMVTGCGSKNENLIEETTILEETTIEEETKNGSDNKSGESNNKTVELAGPVEIGEDKVVALNTKTTIEVSSKESKFKFVVPKDGVYCFMTLGGDVATFGGVWVDGTGYMGGSLGNNMYISEILEQGQTAEIKVSTESNEMKKTTLVVCDEAGAGNFCSGVEVEEMAYYAEVGESITITPKFFDLIGNPMDVTDKDYEVKWYDCTYTESDPILIEVGEGVAHTFENLTEATFIGQDEPREYVIELHKDGVFITQASFYLYNVAGEIEFVEETMEVSEGDKVTLEVKGKELSGDGNIVDLSSDEYTFKWTIEDMDADEIEPELIKGDGYKITIDKVEEKHLCGKYSNIIYAEVFRDGERIGRASFILYDENYK